MDKISRINDLIEGVDLNSSATTLASAYIQEPPKPSFSKTNKKDVVPVIMKPSKTQSGDVQYNVYVENYHPSRDASTGAGDVYDGADDVYDGADDENRTESFTDYENSVNYAPYKNDMDFVTQFYVASLTVVGLYVFFKLVQRGR
jgi:hypothetical protein